MYSFFDSLDKYLEMRCPVQVLGHSLVAKTDTAPPSPGGHTGQPGQNKPVVRIRAKERRAGIRSREFELWAQSVHQRWASLSNISFFEIKKYLKNLS